MAINPSLWGRQLADWQVVRKNMNFLSLRLRLACLAATLVFLAAVSMTQLLCAQEAQTGADQSRSPNNPRQGRNPDAGEVHVLPVQGNIFMLVGAGGNITVQAGDEGILLVDTGLAAMSDRVLEAIRPLSKRPLVYIINTDERMDHTGGNENVGKVGRPVSRGATGAYIIAFVTVLD